MYCVRSTRAADESKERSFGKKFHVDVFDAGCHGYDNGLNTLLKNHHNVALYIQGEREIYEQQKEGG